MPNGLYANIPLELRERNQWCLWRYEDVGAAKPTKVPYTILGKLASVTDPSTWTSFTEAFNAVQLGTASGIGFIFTALDPYTFIDLDDAEGDSSILERHLKVYHEFDSYSEVSPSGKGLHIIVKGKVPAGRRRSKIEIYPSLRYATMTGNVYNNKLIINERQTLLTQLWEQMGNGAVAQSLYRGDEKELYDDKEIIRKASEAVNGDKFVQLLSGKWMDLYQSQSEADFAFIDIVSFYTQNRIQIARIFRASRLGERDKAKRQDYVTGMINRSFDRMLPPIDFDGMKNALEDKLAKDVAAKDTQLALPLEKLNGNVAQRLEPTPHKSSDVGSNPTVPTNLPAKIEPPPGLLGDIAQFIYAQAPRPVPEIALAGAIGLLAGIVGRAYNVNGTGLNQYVLVLAKTGRGKEAAALGIDKLMNAVKMQVPTSTSFRGPGDINSGQALAKFIYNQSKCFVAVIGEFGITIDRISQAYANSADKMLYKLLLDLYNKSGFGQTVQASIYSKKEDSTGVTEAPAVTILGESTHKLFYGALTEDMIAAGLLPRFLIIDYDGDRVPNNENAHLVQPSFQLIEQFASIIAQCEMTMSANRRIEVQYTKEAFDFLKSFDKLADTKINSSRDDVVSELWNRAHMKALRLSALVAVGVNMIEPTITIEYAKWAIDLVQNDIRILSSRFEAGEIGTSSHEIKQSKEIIRVIKDYCSSDYDKVKKYVTDKSQKMHSDKIIPYIYLNKRLSAASVFRLDKSGATVALKRAIQNLVDSDRLKELGKVWCNEKYGTSQRCFVVSDLSILD